MNEDELEAAYRVLNPYLSEEYAAQKAIVTELESRGVKVVLGDAEWRKIKDWVSIP